MRGLGIVLSAVICAMIVIGCKAAVRDKGVYQAEIDFVRAASEESIDNAKAMLDEFCVCEDGEFMSSACEDMAETVAVMDARMSYHLDFMLFLGGVSEERPPKDPPEIAPAEEFCPVKIPLREDLMETDAGINDKID